MDYRIEKALEEKGVYAGKTTGDSMYPMLMQGRDTVIIKKPEFPLKKFDVPVYHNDGHYTMHRIIKVRKNGYVIRGDNRIHREFKTEDEIVGVLAAFYHNGKYVECDDEEFLRYAKQAQRTFLVRVARRAAQKVKAKIKK
ncbi:MAG: S24/S26 family peptidase [Clostridia bacterium]|nr:S24/S26 family peptidase [Clostridia bacterium]